jgi:hypothetical protein
MEMGLALAAAFGAQALLDRFPRWTRLAVGCVALILCVPAAVQYRRYAKKLDRAIDVRSTIEYREAQWFDQNLKGARVFVPGSICFFLNAFTDTQQFGGGFDQGAVNPTFGEFRYQIHTGENAGAEDGRLAVMALQVFGVDAVSVSGPRSREVYKPFLKPKKFDGLLTELWREGDDVIYAVPRRSRSLAHVVFPADLPARAPLNGLDLDCARLYLAALENPALPVAEMRWQSPQSALIQTHMRRDQILSVQISYHPGWRALVKGNPRPVRGDHLGQMVIEPGCDGECTVQMRFDGGAEMRFARLLSWAALLCGPAWISVNVLLGRRANRAA